MGVLIMSKRPYTEQVETLFNKAEKVRNQYQEAKVKAENEASEHAEAIQELEDEAKQHYKMYVLSEITLETYEEAKEKADRKRSMLGTAQQKVNNIDELMMDELQEIHKQIKRLEKDFQIENASNIAEQRTVLFQAKIDYLKAIHNAGNKVKETDKYERMIYDLGVETGFRRDSGFDIEDKRVSDLIHNNYNGKAGLDTFRNEITQAYHKGIVSENIKKEAE